MGVLIGIALGLLPYFQPSFPSLIPFMKTIGEKTIWGKDIKNPE